MGKLQAFVGALGLGTALTCAAVPALPAQYRGIVIFGDSLSDTGNAGRYSNGPVWVEHVAASVGAAAKPSAQGGSNYAVGGARLQGPPGSHSLRAQADSFLAAHGAKLDPRTLYIVYGGGNDLRAAVGAPDVTAAVEGALLSLQTILRDLIAAGATEILVPNLPNLGRTPETRSRGPAAVDAGQRLTTAFNQRLEALLRSAEQQGRVTIHRMDVYALLEQAAADPRAFGLANITEPCAWSGSGAGCAKPETYLFWDSIHPTAAGHAWLGRAALRSLGLQGG